MSSGKNKVHKKVRFQSPPRPLRKMNNMENVSLDLYYKRLNATAGQHVEKGGEGAMPITPSNVLAMLMKPCKLKKYKESNRTWKWILENDYDYFRWCFRRFLDVESNVFRLLAPICMSKEEIAERVANSRDTATTA